MKAFLSVKLHLWEEHLYCFLERLRKEKEPGSSYWKIKKASSCLQTLQLVITLKGVS